ncbi:penicillin-insensitive murein endopeptidase [Nannocystaceae bacterium ST9]
MSATLQVIDPEGRARSVPFVGMQMSLGRAADNQVVLDHPAGGVSSHHCVIGLGPARDFVIQDRGSTNGTWIGERKVEGTMPLQVGARVSVGGYLVVVEVMAAVRSPTSLGGGAPRMPLAPVRGPLLTKTDEEHQYRRFRDSIARYAAEWDRKGRSASLLLPTRMLPRAEAMIDTDHEQPFDELELSFIRASRAGHQRGRLGQMAALGGGGLLVLSLGLWALLRDGGVEAEDEVAQVDEAEQADEVEPLPNKPVEPLPKHTPGVVKVAKKEWIEHQVIPAETLEDIALRYAVPLPQLVTWNGIGEDDPLEPGQIIKVKAENPPLAWQQITYSPEKRESWSSLAKRFDVPVDKLRAYNPTLGEKLSPSDEITIWITPRPLKRREGVTVPTFEVRPDAVSIGAPHDGRLENAIQFPENEQLYKRRSPNIMWCGSYMAANLLHAIALFRYTYEFEGEMVVADMSAKNGGHFEPHKSHQAGRDVDIWLPTLKGVYKRDHLEKERKPFWWEADWFALYGFIKALHETGSVHAVFLDWNLQEKVYEAAKLMGASDEELEQMITWPRPQSSRTALLQHSDGHIRHIHVRFKCGPADVDCSNAVRAHEAGD